MSTETPTSSPGGPRSKTDRPGLLKKNPLEKVDDSEIQGNDPHSSKSAARPGIRFIDTGKARRAGITKNLIDMVMAEAGAGSERIDKILADLRNGSYEVPSMAVAEKMTGSIRTCFG